MENGRVSSDNDENKDLSCPKSLICKCFVPACASLLDSCVSKGVTSVQVMAGIQNLIKVVKDISSGEELASIILMTAASRVLPSLMRQVATQYDQAAVVQVVHAVQRLAWKLEAGLLAHGDQTVNVHGLIFCDGREDSLFWAMLPPPPSALPLTNCIKKRQYSTGNILSPKRLSCPRKNFSFDVCAAMSADELKLVLPEQVLRNKDVDSERVQPNGNIGQESVSSAASTDQKPKFEVGQSIVTDPDSTLEQDGALDNVFEEPNDQVILRHSQARSASSLDAIRYSSTDGVYSAMKNSLKRQSSVVTMNELSVPAEFLSSGSNVNEILERSAFEGRLPSLDLRDEFKMLHGRKHKKSQSMFYTDLPIEEESSEQSGISNPSTPVKMATTSRCNSECMSPVHSASDDCLDSPTPSPTPPRRQVSRFRSLSERLSKLAHLGRSFSRQESLESPQRTSCSMENLLESNDKFAHVSVKSIQKRASSKISGSDVSQRWFEINLKTNVDEYEEKFCRVYKQYRDVLELHDAIAKVHGTAHLPPKLSTDFTSTSSVAAQIERHLNAVLAVSEFRACHELIDFFSLVDEDDDVKEGEDAERRLLISFFTPYMFTSKDSKKHWPKVVDLPGPARSPMAARKVMNQMTVRRRPTHRSAEETNMDQHLCIVIKEDNEQVMMLVWDEETDTHVVAAGTVEHLVEHLANEDRPDPGYVKTFLMGYRHFMASEDLIDRLLTRFNVELPEESTDEEKEYMEKWGLVVQLRTVDVLTQWMERCWFDFHDKEFMLDRVNAFIDELKGSDNLIFKSLGDSLKKVKSKKIEEELKRIEAAKLAQPLEPSPLSFDDFTATELAKQLTLTELGYLKAIEPSEFIRVLWEDHPGTRDERKRALSPNICEYIDHFNRVCFWVGTEVLSCSDVRQRAACLEKMIDIAKLCRSYNNFNTSMAIMTGLNYSAVSSRRLKHSWEHVSLKSQASLEEIEDLFSSESNFIMYRRLQGSLKRTAPCIPFFGLYSKDFVFLNDGNPKRLANGLVNFSKLRMIMHRVTDLEWYQHSKFPFAAEDNVEYARYCKKLKALGDEELYELSLQVEPKT